MSDPLTIGALAALALATAATGIIKNTVGDAVNAAYKALKSKVAVWSKEAVPSLEQDPTSHDRQDVVASVVDLQREADKIEVAVLTERLIDAIKSSGGESLFNKLEKQVKDVNSHNAAVLSERLSDMNSSIQELCDVLAFRANGILESARWSVQRDELHKFISLHHQHISALKNGRLILAHGILNEIHDLLKSPPFDVHTSYAMWAVPQPDAPLNYANEYFDDLLVSGRGQQTWKSSKPDVVESINRRYCQFVMVARIISQTE